MRDFLVIVTTDNNTRIPIKVLDVKNATESVLIAMKHYNDESYIIKGVEVIDLISTDIITLYED